MAHLTDWLELTGTTLRTVGTNGVGRLYDLEWPAARRKLLEEHQAAIEGEPKRIRRWIRISSALMYGLAKRLTPERRILFLVAQLVGAISIVYLLTLHADSTNSVKVIASLALAFALITFLLAMELIDKIRFRDELELARELQSSLLPSKMPTMPGWDVGAKEPERQHGRRRPL